ncbi:DUF7336 domain-containing protein [Lactococcus lactis]|uniref:DUF7336 domain-containing protein n=1 Tax=Lactococcus lactis TaxID=1358 RepID=UPI00111143E3|nr:hypothetical protein [Lactococcus lactis]
MKVYVLTADTYDGNWGSSIVLFGVFSTEEKAQKQADEMELDYYDISRVNIDENVENIYLGGYIE